MKVCPQWPERKRGIRCGLAWRKKVPWRRKRQPSAQRWKRQSVRGQCGGTKAASALDMPADPCSSRAHYNLRRTIYKLPRMAAMLPVNLHEYEPLARASMSDPAWDYLAGGSGDER